VSDRLTADFSPSTLMVQHKRVPEVACLVFEIPPCEFISLNFSNHSPSITGLFIFEKSLFQPSYRLEAPMSGTLRLKNN
jgi:hypothetical protein